MEWDENYDKWEQNRGKSILHFGNNLAYNVSLKCTLASI